MKKQKIVVIAGPTGVGKSDLAISLAEKFNGEIISSDSMQIYRRLDIGTGKVDSTDISRVKHHLIDIVEPDFNDFSVSDFVSLARGAIDDISSRGKTPFIVGGTGLYISALLFGFSLGGKKRDDEIGRYYESFLESHGSDELHKLLEKIDPETAQKIHPNKTRAVIRALELATTSEEKLKNRESEFDYLLIGLSLDREVLYKKINNRTEKMFEDGFVDEVKSLLKSGVKNNCPAMKAIGYREVSKYIDGEYSFEKCKDLTKQFARNYAKRQITWLKKMNGIVWFSPQDKKQIEDKILQFIKD